ncbi:3-oxoacyl-ACP reductase FabG [Streptomyces sp. Ru72]|uniref:3-oxoacyl-ACP reductase FabG n=1 Tax=Streptomyces sp. Ru72 TaxID=2080747 RepID=UPI000CDE4A98|nr:3-oxoacyl-ACP reductase FabG [Streptomyces sp. Ru72]POX45971.1 beta-ketoacyl-ACP reductase [Streptomyces sp. Ru72]
MAQEIRKTALVSGGSRGIGRAVVLRLARDGYRVAFCYQNPSEAVQSLEKEAAELGATVVSRQVGVTDAAAVRSWVQDTEEELGPLDLVVNSAGIVRDTPLVMMKDEDWGDVIDVNLTGTFLVSRAAVFGMMKRKSGCIVNISSVAGVHGNATQTNYSASKAGIIGFTKALSKETGRYGIRANAVAPGFIDTDMVSGLSDSFREKAVQGVSLRRFGTPEEVAEAVAYLAEAQYVTGTVLEIDGGLSI